MSDLATALATDPNRLPEFEGRQVIRTSIKMTNAGDGLSEALSIDPQVLKVGQEVTVTIRAVVTEVAHKVAKGYEADEPNAPLGRVATLKAGDATIIDHDLVAEQFHQQSLRLQEAKDAAANQQTVGGEGWDDEHAEMDDDDNVHPFPGNGTVIDGREESDSGTDDEDSYYDPEASTAPGEPDDSPL